MNDDSTNKIQKYTPNEVFRTAFKYVENTSKSSSLPHGVNQVCISCKAGSELTYENGTIKKFGQVEKIIDQIDLKPWSDFYKEKEFAAYKCRSCGYQWSWYK